MNKDHYKNCPDLLVEELDLDQEDVEKLRRHGFLNLRNIQLSNRFGEKFLNEFQSPSFIERIAKKAKEFYPDFELIK